MAIQAVVKFVLEKLSASYKAGVSLLELVQLGEVRAGVDYSWVMGQAGDEGLCNGCQTQIIGLDNLLHLLVVRWEACGKLLRCSPGCPVCCATFLLPLQACPYFSCPSSPSFWTWCCFVRSVAAPKSLLKCNMASKARIFCVWLVVIVRYKLVPHHYSQLPPNTVSNLFHGMLQSQPRNAPVTTTT